jgi:hypothetical protein
MIESGPKIMDYISSPSDNLDGDSQDGFTPRTFTLRVTESTYSLSGTPGKDFKVEKVLFGPFGLY